MRNYLFETWRGVARRCGFVEYETPILEDTALYLKKSGGELSSQLFRFEDQGGRDVTLRPEVTASLARIAAVEQRQYPKPLKWFEIGQCFRYEKPQKGRGREFHQFNVDILGEAGPGADAELIALAIETMLAFGFVAGDFVVRVSDRNAWLKFADGKGVEDSRMADFLGLVDKLEREKPEVLTAKLAAFGMTLEEVKAFVANPANASKPTTRSARISPPAVSALSSSWISPSSAASLITQAWSSRCSIRKNRCAPSRAGVDTTPW